MKKAVGIFSGILAFITLVFGICLILTAIGWPVSTERFQELIAELRKMPAVLLLLLSGLICIAMGTFILYGIIGDRMNRRTSALLERNTIGETFVSFSTLEQIAENTAKSFSEVKSCKTKIRAIGSSITISVRVVTAPTVSLLEMTHALQDKINASITELCGKAIGSVDVTIDQADIPPKKAK